MPKFAVGYLNLLDENELIVEIIEAPSWKQALGKHSEVSDDLTLLTNNMEQAKRYFLGNCARFDVKEISK
jgi:hypothetical protein